jgi:nucleoid DNA-binding protein
MTQHLNFNKSDLVLSMAKKLGISESNTLLRIDHLIKEMTTQVALDSKIEIRGFGVFRKKYIRPRKFSNPKTKEVTYIGETTIFHFKPSKKLINSND